VSLADCGGLEKTVVAIDGPAGSGKSTVARQSARALGFDYVDTGAMYRAITLSALRQGIDPGDASALAKIAKESIVAFKQTADGSLRVTLNDKDITDGIRMPDVTANVSAVSAHAGVREALVDRQREMAAMALRGVVIEGRDVGTVVFPQAMLKIYLHASIEERARRRQKDLAQAGVSVDDGELVKLLKTRDRLDSSRDLSPLAKAGDAMVVDTTKMTIAEAVGLITRLTQEKRGAV